MPHPVRLFPLVDLPLIQPGDNLAALFVSAAASAGGGFETGDVLVVAQKVVSKAEGRLVDLGTVNPSPRAALLAAEIGKDPRLVEVILGESHRVVRSAPGVLIVETKLGFICANAGVDHSNVGPNPDLVALLPESPDRSAAGLVDAIRDLTGAVVAVIINDSHGRPWREGTVGVAIGAAGLVAVEDCRGKPDLYGRPLAVTTVGAIDELAAAASLVMGQANEGLPAVIVRGARWTAAPADGGAQAVIRRAQTDLFR